MMIPDNFRMAIGSLRSARLRSFLTMLGIIIGVASVVTTVSLGEGIKHQVSGQLNSLGSDLITVRPGKISEQGQGAAIGSLNVFSAGLGSGSLSEADLQTVRQTSTIREAVPFSLISGVPSVEGHSFDKGLILATNGNVPELLNQKVEFGAFIKDDESDRQVAVIGASAADAIFQEVAPIGKTMQIRGQDFIIRGVLEKTTTNPLTPGPDFNNTIFIPYNIGKSLSGGTAPIYQILAKPTNPEHTQGAITDLTNNMKASHGGQEDFSVLDQKDNLKVTNEVVGLLTKLIGGIAAVSLLVGGIGIMNVMLVSVSERTREIGIRKAVGATTRQIRTQFLIEAVVLSVWGATIGLLIAGFVNIALRVSTHFEPVITWQVVAIAAGVSVLVGVIFGAAPAFKAARKDPIEALRSM
jgi:putative ABC transport system permease protein